MIPILYDKYEQDFLSDGLGQLGDCLTCTVTEEVNGIYELELTYSMTGAYYEQLINFGGVVACTHDHNGDIQLFDIYKYSAPIDGIVTFYGSHVSYRLGDWVRIGAEFIMLPGGGLTLPRNPAELFQCWNNSGQSLFLPLGTFTFTDYTDYPISNGFSSQIPYVLRDAMFNTEEDNIFVGGSVMQRWKGEWQFDKFSVNYYKKRGTDRGVQIRYGKNMTGVERERDTGSIISVIVPYGNWEGWEHRFDPVYSPQVETNMSPWNSTTQVYCNGEIMFFKPAVIRAIPLNITDQFQSEPTQAQVDDYCRSYMSKSSTWRADDNITVEFLDLYGTPEYEGIEGLSNCLCGDYVSILYPQLGIVSDGVEIMSLTYDVLAERVVEMQLNSIRTTLAQVIIDTIGGAK